VATSALAAEAPPHGSSAQGGDDFSRPFLDVDEWRDHPVRHRYVHGGFRGTDLLFSIYFPPKDQYQGRFFQPLAAISGSENSAPMAMFQASGVGFAAASGGYLVESNQGSRDMFGGTYQANAAVAQYSRTLAADMYGPHRPYGYVYGGSGGAFKTLGCVENTTGVWDGSIPFVHGSPVAIPNCFTIQAHALRLLWNRFPQIVDALDPGGSGDMYAGLNEEERAALLETTRMGFPPRAWFNRDRIAFGYTGVFTSLVDMIVDGDPGYFEDFWTKPGYLGANPPASLRAARIQHPTKIAALIMPDEAKRLGLSLTMSAGQAASGVIFPAALKLESVPQGDLQGASILVRSGGAQGAVLYIAGVRGDVALIGFGAKYFRALAALAPGDEVQLDNSVYLAAQTYHRHQVQAPEYYVWDQFRGPDGKAVYPQRPKIVNQGQSGGSTMNGRFDGKMIVISAMMDEAAYPWQADWFRNRVHQAQGANFDDKYRLWFVDNATHTTQAAGSTDKRPVATTRVISYQGVLQQALRDLAAWVEKGVAPPPGTDYVVREGQIIVPPSAAKRKGLQPVVSLTADGGPCATVKVGQAVAFEGVVEAPPGAGKVVAAEWDFEGDGAFPITSPVTEPATRVSVSQAYIFTAPGIYFPALRASIERNGDAASRYARPQNLGRVRVVVH
jgi:hypothetical protein